MAEKEKNGVVVIDKPENMSSAQVVARIKRIFGVAKAGHTGTLDPMATGALICCLNRATRLSRFFLSGTKTYDGVLLLGVETDTQDGAGKIVSTKSVSDISENDIISEFKKFEGWIDQAPPVYSALKHRGVPLYKWARQGSPVQKPPRRIHIDRIKILGIDSPAVDFTVSCSSGTYIRSLCSDVGKALGCGGHLKKLRRIECGGFDIGDAITLPELEAEREKGGELNGADGRIIGMAEALRGMPFHRADPFLLEKIKNGVKLIEGDIPEDAASPEETFLKVVDGQNNLAAVLEKAAHGNRYAYCCVF